MTEAAGSETFDHDSLAFIELISAIEEEMGVSLTDGDLEGLLQSESREDVATWADGLSVSEGLDFSSLDDVNEILYEMFGEDPDDSGEGLAGVREPRRPLPSDDSDSMAKRIE